MTTQNEKMCFACGKDNPIGLQLTFNWQNEQIETYFTPREVHQGYTGMMHGGLISTLLDEVMANYLHLKNIKAVTGKLEVRFRKPVPIGQQVRVVAKLDSQKRQMYKLSSVLYLKDGSVAAEGTSSFVRLE